MKNTQDPVWEMSAPELNDWLVSVGYINYIVEFQDLTGAQLYQMELHELQSLIGAVPGSILYRRMHAFPSFSKSMSAAEVGAWLTACGFSTGGLDGVNGAQLFGMHPRDLGECNPDGQVIWAIMHDAYSPMPLELLGEMTDMEQVPQAPEDVGEDTSAGEVAAFLHRRGFGVSVGSTTLGGMSGSSLLSLNKGELSQILGSDSLAEAIYVLLHPSHDPRNTMPVEGDGADRVQDWLVATGYGNERALFEDVDGSTFVHMSRLQLHRIAGILGESICVYLHPNGAPIQHPSRPTAVRPRGPSRGDHDDRAFQAKKIAVDISVPGHLQIEEAALGPAELASPVDDVEEVICVDGATFYGGVDDGGLPQGEGTVVYADGGQFQGELHHGKRHGVGREENEEAVFEGQFKDDEKDGLGIEYFFDGSRYDGYFVEGIRCGHGTFQDENGVYHGEWSDGERHGLGTFYYPSGAYCVGLWSNGLMHGRGIYVDPKGDAFGVMYNDGVCENKTAFSDSVLGGEGEDMYTYMGDMDADGAPNGLGIQVFSDNGGQFVGQFTGGMRHGYGTYLSEDGSQFHGHWESDLRTGCATYYYENGSASIGAWAADEMEGDAIFNNVEGTSALVKYTGGGACETLRDLSSS